MNKLINDPATVISDALHGFAAAHPEVRVDHDNRLVVRGDAPVRGKVGLVSGGGSGHEPLHAGFVGAGMLDAACAGRSSPRPCRTRWPPPPARWTAGPGCCTSSRTTRATS